MDAHVLMMVRMNGLKSAITNNMLFQFTDLELEPNNYVVT